MKECSHSVSAQKGLHSLWSLLECAAPGRSSVRDPGLTANPQHALVPPRVYGSWPLLAVWEPWFPVKLLCTHSLSWSVRLLAVPHIVGPRFTGLVPQHTRQAIAARQHPWRQQYCSFRLVGQSPALSSCAPCLHRQWTCSLSSSPMELPPSVPLSCPLVSGARKCGSSCQ